LFVFSEFLPIYGFIAKSVRDFGSIPGFCKFFWTDVAIRDCSKQERMQQMHTYNSNTIATFVAVGAMPDYAQVRNEITSGMLWPFGGPLSGNGGTNWSQLG
jgi:arabinogalactan endo-1,4-beta-galactosidase